MKAQGILSLSRLRQRFFAQGANASEMKPVPKKWAVLIGIFVLAALALWSSQPDDPVQWGRPLSSWVRNYDNGISPAAIEANEVIRELGSNALPWLVAELKTPDSPIKDGLLSLVTGYEWLHIKRDPARGHRMRALHGLRALGPQATPALPQLEAEARSGDLAELTIKVISATGAPGLEVLQRIAADNNPDVRQLALLELGMLRERALSALPVVLNALKDRSLEVQHSAVASLTMISTDTTTMLPVAGLLQSRHKDTRQRVAALCDYPQR